MRASAVPLRLPKPRWRPMRRARFSSRARERECMVTGFLMMRPSATSLRTVWRELALEISDTSLGSSQIFRWPQPRTDDASRFWVLRLTLQPDKKRQHSDLQDFANGVGCSMRGAVGEGSSMHLGLEFRTRIQRNIHREKQRPGFSIEGAVLGVTHILTD